MKNYRRIKQMLIGMMAIISINACKGPAPLQSDLQKKLPSAFFAEGSADSLDQKQLDWRNYFKDRNLVALIDTALLNNQSYNIILQEIQLEKNEIRARKGEYLPKLGIMAEAAADKPARYTRNGAVEANGEIREGKEFPEPLNNFMVGAYASWEIDVWKKLRNAKKSVVLKYLSSSEGRNYMRTRLVAEIAANYYQLLSLDNQLLIVQQNISIQQKALKIVRLEKQAAQLTELAVRRFEAEVAKNQSYLFDLQQDIIETENRINFLLGRLPQRVQRTDIDLRLVDLDSLRSGTPSQLIQNRPDIRAAELKLKAAHLDVKTARANFYPSLGLDAALGYEAYQSSLLFKSPESMLFGIAGNLFAPLINRNAIRAAYLNANAKQRVALLEYEKTLLEAFTEVYNQLSNLKNLERNYKLKNQQVVALNRSIEISIGLFKSARADYMEVLLTQREALEARVELIRTRQEQLEARIALYQALGGG